MNRPRDTIAEPSPVEREPDGGLAPLSTRQGPMDLLDEPVFVQRYALEGTLGAGGMGVVRVCTDRRFGRQVALKTMLPGTADSDPDAVARFLREAHIQGQLEHPAIVPVHDVGRAPDGNVYFTMKRIRGETLDAIVARLRAGDRATARRYTRRKLLTAFSTVCMAVHLAHLRGVVHRDLKPANLIFGDFGEVYVLDWGIARVTGETSPDGSAAAVGSTDALGAPATPPTAVGSLLGTPGYMSPEQARGQPDVDARADVFALGATLYEILTSQPLVDKGTPAAMLAATIEGVDAHARRRAPDAEVPPELEELCVRATALRAADRLEGAQALSDAIERFLDGDRDLESRREHARAHAEAAKQAADTALEEAGDAGDDVLRAEAMREAGRALALDPTNADAMTTITRLMSRPPRNTPSALRDAIREADVAGRSSSLRAASMAIAAQVALLAVVIACMGVRDWRAVGLVLGLGLLSVVTVAIGSTSTSLLARTATLVVPQLFVASTALLVGPLLLMPMFALHASAAQLGGSMRPPAPLVLALPVAAIVVLPLLQWAGALGRSYEFLGDRMLIFADAVALGAAPTTVFLVVVNVMTLLAAAALVIQKQRQLQSTDLRLRLVLWHLHWLVPETDAAQSGR
jgi:serine/threonine protein kinase